MEQLHSPSTLFEQTSEVWGTGELNSAKCGWPVQKPEKRSSNTIDQMNMAPYVTQISRRAAQSSAIDSESKVITGLVAILLFLLLVFTTATVWVRHGWALQIFQIGIYSLVAVRVLGRIRSDREEIAQGVFPVLVYLIPVWGVVQVVFHTTTSSFDTRAAVLRWGALAGVFYLTQTVTGSKVLQQRFLTAVLCFATAMAVIFLLQFNTSDGRVLWLFSTGYSPIYATFQNKNNYVQFVEVALPIALWGTVREGWRSWWYAITAGVLYASAIGAASRAGFILCNAELLVVAILGLVRIRRNKANWSFRVSASILLMVPIVGSAFTFAVGWDEVLARFKEKDPFYIRREYLLGAINMAKQRPLTGYGLDTFEQVYQRFAIKDFGAYANHVHNDWAEFAADGGIPFLVLIAVPFLAAFPTALRHPWGLGVVATTLHACVDYPFPRPGVSAWMFAVLAVLYMTRRSDQRQAPP